MDLTPPRKRRRGEVKLTEGNLIDKLGAAICSLGSSELAILQLLNHYDIDLDDLRRVLLDKGLDVSFSRVKYFDIAPRVGLKFELAGNDMPTFDIHRARIPTPLFGDIINDLEVVMKQYGLPIRHKNVEARSRLLAPLFNRIVALFDLTIFNAPESIFPGRMKTRGRVEYHFLVFGGLSVLVIEAKLLLGTADGRMNAIAQVIAECDACDYANDRLDFHPSTIYGILCDGKSFQFFSFDGSHTKPDGSPAKPVFSRGVFRNPTNSKPYRTLTIAEYDSTSDDNFIRSIRPICETLFYFFLLAYKTGVDMYTERSARNGIEEKRPRENTPCWAEAQKYAQEALVLAMDTRTVGEMAEGALDRLRKSLAAVPGSHKSEISLSRAWKEGNFEYC